MANMGAVLPIDLVNAMEVLKRRADTETALRSAAR
jgi:hypothetical protein